MPLVMMDGQGDIEKIKPDQDCRRVAKMQAELFEQSVFTLSMSSKIFFRRFMKSEVAKEFDSLAILDDTKTIGCVFDDLEKQYGPSSYGSAKYHSEVMYWAGYLYRHFCYCYEVSSKQAYKMLPLDYVASTYEPYHSLDIMQAIDRLLESKGISFDPDEINKRAVKLLREIRK